MAIYNNTVGLNFNYVFFFDIADYYKIMFKDVLNMPNVSFCGNLYINNKILQVIQRIHCSSKVNSFVNLPLRDYWNKYYFNNNFDNDKRIIFVFHGAFFPLLDVDYFSYLRIRYPNCICIMFFTDTVNSYYKHFTGRYCKKFDIELVKSTFDFVLSYNKEDVNRYNLIYYPLWYSKINFHKQKEDIDVFFVGLAKDRLNLIHKIYGELSAIGLNCKFFVSDVARENQIYEGILYNKKLSYIEVLKYVNRAKGILELTQGGACGFTLRLLEALTYNKILITDNKILEEYNDANWVKYGKIIQYEGNISLTKNEYYNLAKADYKYKGEYSPVNLLKFLAMLVKDNYE